VSGYTVELFVPWRPSADGVRDRPRMVDYEYLQEYFGDWLCGLADDPGPGEFRRSRACNAAAAGSEADVLVFNDADSIVLPGQIHRAVELAADDHGAHRAYTDYHRLTRAASDKLTFWRDALFAAAEDVIPLAPSHGVWAVWRETFVDLLGYDPRFVYFYDDFSFDIRSTDVYQERIPGELYHLWHPPRQVPESDEDLWRRYEREDPDTVRAEAGWPL